MTDYHRILVGVAVLLWVQGPVHAGEQPGAALVVLPLAPLGASDEECARVRQRLIAELRRRFEVTLLPEKAIQPEIKRLCGQSGSLWDCLEEETNLFRLGERLKARFVVAGRLAVAGDHQALKLVIVEVSTGTSASEMIHLNQDKSDAFPARLLLLQDRLTPPGGDPGAVQRPIEPQPVEAVPRESVSVEPVPLEDMPGQPEVRWYQSWETWTIAGLGVAVVLGVVVMSLSLSSGSGDVQADLHRTLP